MPHALKLFVVVSGVSINIIECWGLKNILDDINDYTLLLFLPFNEDT